MGQKIATAVLELTTEDGQMFRAIDELERRAGTLDKSWRDTGKSLQAFGRQTTDVGASLTKMTLPLVAIGAGAAKAAIDFESSFAGVRKTVDATDEEFAALAQGFRDLSKTIPVNVNELNRLGEAAGALGIPKAEIIDFARVMAMLGVTTNLTSDQAAESIAKIQNIFGAAGKDTEQFASTLVALGNDGASTETQILELANRIASAGNAVGLSQGQVLGFSAAIANVGIEAEAGGTAMSKTLIEISQAVSRGGEDLAKFAKVAGLSSAEFAKAFKADAADATRIFIEGLGRIKNAGGDLNTVIEDLGVKEVRQSNLLRSLALSGDNVSRSLQLQATAWRENSALSEEAGKRFETLQSQGVLLWNRVQDIAISLGNALVPAIKAVVSALDGLIPMLERAVSVFTAMPTWIQGGVIALGVLAAAAGPVVFVIGQLITSIGIVTAGMWAFGNTIPVLTARLWLMEAAASTMGIVLLNVAKASAVVAVAWASWQIGRWIGEWSGLTDVIGRVSSKLLEMIGLLPEGSNEQYKAMRASQKAAEAAAEHAKALQKTGAALTDAGDAAKKDFVGPIKQVNQVTEQSEEQLKATKKQADEFAKSLKAIGGADALVGAREVIKQLNAMGGPLKVLPSQLEAMADKLRAGAQAAMLMGNANLAGNYTKLAQTLSPVIQFQQRYNVTLGEYATDAKTSAALTEDMWEQFFRLSGQLQTIPPLLKNTFQPNVLVPFRSATAEMGREFAQVGKSFSETLGELSQSFGSLAQVSGGTFGEMVQWLGNLTGSSNLASRAGSTLREGFDKLGSGAKNSAAGVAQMATGLVSMVAAMAQATEGTDKLTNALSGASAGASFGGEVGGGWGALIGAIVGGIVGIIRAGSAASRELREAQVEIDALNNGLIDTYGSMDRLEAKANTVGMSFEQFWGATGRNNLEAMNRTLAEFEKRMKAVVDAAKAAVDGFGAVVTTMTEPWIVLGEKIKAARAEMVAAADEVTRLQQDKTASAEQIAAAQAKLAESTTRLMDLERQQAEEAKKSKQALDDLGVQAIATFTAALMATGSFTAALKQAGPALKALSDAYKALGLEVEDVALKQLLAQAAMAEANPALMTGVAGLASSMQALAKMGLLNAETFAAMQRTGQEMYVRLQAEAEKTGAGARGALLPMQDFLRQAAAQAKLLGIPLDANTQMLIDQSKELGIWQETGESAQDKMITGMEALNESVRALVDAILGISNAINSIPSQKTTTFEARYIDPGPPPGWGGGGEATSSFPTAIPMAEGGMGRVTQPTLFMAGEAGDEDYAFSGGGKRFGEAPGGNFAALKREFSELRREMSRDRRLIPLQTATMLRSVFAKAGAF